MSTQPVSWHYVGEFDTPAIALFVLISEDGAKVVVIGVTAGNEYVIWSADTDVLDRGSYAAITTDPYDLPAGNVAASKDLSLIFIPLQSNQLLIIEAGSITSVVNLPSGYTYVSGWVSCSPDGLVVIVEISGADGDFGFYYSDDSGVSWRYVQEFDPDTGIGYAPYYSCVSGDGLTIYAPGFTGGGFKQGYSTSGIDSVSISDIDEPSSKPSISEDGSSIFTLTTSGATTGLFVDPVGTLSLLLDGARAYAIKSTGATIIAGTGDTEETALVQHSTDTGASWANGPEGIVAYDSSLAVAFNGSRLGAIETTAGHLWLTGILSDQTGSVVLSGNVPTVSIDSLLTLIGYAPEITSDPVDPTGLLRLLGYAPSVLAIEPSGLLQLLGYAPTITGAGCPDGREITLTLTPQNGGVIKDVVVTAYIHGTSTKAALYTDSGMTTALENPFTTSEQSTTFYAVAAGGSYDFLIRYGSLGGHYWVSRICGRS